MAYYTVRSPRPRPSAQRKADTIVCVGEADTIPTDSVPTDATPTIHSQDDPVHL